jgi:protein TonB
MTGAQGVPRRLRRKTMAAQRAVPAGVPNLRYDDSNSANNRLKSRFRPLFWSSVIFATAAHFGAFMYWPELTAEDFSYESAEIATFELPPEVKIPDAPQAIARPATPVVATTEISEDITIAPTTFETNPVAQLPPPPTLKAEAIPDEEMPRFTPFTVAPEILNRDEIVDAMMKGYPTVLRNAGIGGVVMVFFFIDETGRVKTTRVAETSGYPQLDQAAVEIAELYRFSPALNRDQKVPVWVSFPVTFAVVH